MAHRWNCAARRYRTGKLEGERKLRGHRHLADVPARSLLESKELLANGRTEHSLGKCAMTKRINERAFHVEAEYFSAGRGVHQGAELREDRLRVFGIATDRAHQERGHAVARRPCRVVADSLRIAREERMPAAAVDVHIDKSGANGEACHVDRFGIAGVQPVANRDNLPILAEHVGA